MEEQRQGRWSKVRIYLDSYIAACFWLHLLCLYLTGTILKNRNGRIRKRRLVTAALCCTGMDAVAVLLLPELGIGTAPVVSFGGAIIGLILGAGLAFGKARILANTLLLLGITALFAGFFQIVPIRNVGLFCLVGTLVLPLLENGITAVFRARQTTKWMYEVKLYRNNEKKVLSAFMDTGNRLRLFGSSLPVVLVDERYLTEWINAAATDAPQKLVFLPYKGVGGRGLLHGVRLHCVLASENGQTVSGEVAAVAAEHKLFQGCDYQMILQPEVLAMEGVVTPQEGENNVI